MFILTLLTLALPAYAAIYNTVYNRELCLTYNSGAPLQLSTCTYYLPFQVFYPIGSGENNKISSRWNPFDCWTVPGPLASGAKVTFASCDGPVTTWHHSGDKFRINGTKYCLDLPGGRAEAGAQLQIWECMEGNQNQVWIEKYP